MPEVYPLTLPQPLLTPYDIEVDAGLLRTTATSGLVRQRRLYDVMPQTFELSFVVPLTQLFSWQFWLGRFAYDYVQMDLVSSLSGQQCAPHFVRLISNIELEMLDKGLMSARVVAELSPAQLGNYNPPPGDNWIIGGSPQFPSSANYVIAGSPITPSPNFVLAGTPASPSI